VIDRGTARGLSTGCPNGGKTGTTSNNTDVWFVGITPRLSTAVWVGFPDDTRTLGSSTFGATIPGPIWQDFMVEAKGDFCGDWPVPKEPFDGTSFFGTYASAHSSGGTGSTDGTTDGTVDGDDGEDGTTTTPGDGTDPDDAYANPPQSPPSSPNPTPTAPTEGGGAGAPTG